MGKNVTLVLVLVLAASSILGVLSVKGEHIIIVVPDDYPTISAAVENAADGDAIFVKNGTYEINEDSLLINKTISIIGEDQTNTVLVFPPDTRTGYEFFISKIGFRVSADNFKISRLTITNCDFGISVSGNGTEVSKTKMLGISVSGSHSLISDNIITGTLTIKGSYNTITRNSGACCFEIDGDFNTIAENAAYNDINFKGANIITTELKGSKNVITGNSFSTMYLEYTDSNMISNNSLSCLWVGFYGHACSNNTFSNNRVIGPGLWGILMGAGSYNVFHDNLISNYTGSYDGYGIAIGGNHLIAEHNTFYRNILVNNNMHVSANWEILGSGNYWDNGKEGNYWDDYTSTDINGDGIGDAPYTIKGYSWDDNAGGHVNFVFGQDNYPLMAPFNIDNAKIEMPDWASTLFKPSTKPEPTPTPNPTSTLTPVLPESEPNPTLLVAATSGASAAIVSIGLIFYFKKRKQ